MDARRFEPRIRALFAENFAEYRELGASVAIWEKGQEILSLADGFRDRQKTERWDANTPVLFWSATKGLAAACLLHACQESGTKLESRVAEKWPEFAANGKGEVTIAELLSHQSGLPALSRGVSVFDYDGVVSALTGEAPQWPRGMGHGYHPRTFGFLVDELLRRIAGVTLREYWRISFAGPLQLDLWIGIDPARTGQVAPIFASRTPPPQDDPFYAAFFTPNSLTARAFASPRGLHRAAELNTVEARTTSFPAFGGIGTARSLAKFYAMLADGGTFEGRRFFAPDTHRAMTTILTQGHDRVLQVETAFSAGYMLDPLDRDDCKLRGMFGPSPRAFGHPGAGGSHAFADPENGLAFAYVMNQMEPGVLPNAKSLRLIDALYA